MGLALLCAASWGAAHLASSAWAGLGAGLALTVAGALALRGSAMGLADDVWPTAVGAVLLGSIPFLVEMRFGIMGTSLNPDMSQHLFAADRIEDGGEERLVSEGYPLGPHALVASVAKLGPSLVHGFGGLMLATAVAAALAPLGLLRHLERSRRIAGALLVGMAYLAASYFIQGAFKETMQALFMLAFAIGLTQLTADREVARAAVHTPRWSRLKAVPLGALAVGSVYAYSFPGLAWLLGTLGVWAAFELIRARSARPFRAALVPTLAAVLGVLILAAPEIPRMVEFGRFETFNPDGAGLGNLFNAISPIEALGIWPSGDFRLDPGTGFAPAFVFYAGGVVGGLALGFGLFRALRAGETALAAAITAGAVLYAYALVDGTPYQEAKALAVIAPVAALVAVRGCLQGAPPVHTLRNAPGRALVVPALALVFLIGAAGSTALALVNGPVGPPAWTPALLEFSEEAEGASMLAVLEDDFAAQNGIDLVTWELRGREVCVLPESEVSAATVSDRAFEAVVVVGELSEPLPVVGRLESLATEEAGGLEYQLFDAKLSGSKPDCPFVADGDRAEPR